MTTPPNTSFTTRLNPSLSQSSIPESSSSSAYPHQYLPRRSHSERSQQRSSHHHARDNDLPPLPIPDMSAEARRQSLMAMDRKRRLTASSQETGRRRTTTGGFTNRDNQFYHTRPSGQISQPSASPTPASALTQVIDLTASSPPAPVRPNVPSRSHRTSSTGSRGYVVPSWQPDTDVSECPICKRPFTFLFRRHHCRKCGRVVCNECSPHRITIPRQYIVHPPGEEEQSLFSNPNIVDLTRDEDDNTGHPASPLRINPALGGGEKVRLCNPCVPDPQPELQSIFNEPASRPLPLPPAPPANSSLFPSQSSVPGFSRYSPQVLPPPRFSNPRDQPLPQLPHPGTRVHVESDEEDDEIGSSFERYHNSTSRRLIVSELPCFSERELSCTNNHSLHSPMPATILTHILTHAITPSMQLGRRQSRHSHSIITLACFRCWNPPAVNKMPTANRQTFRPSPLSRRLSHLPPLQPPPTLDHLGHVSVKKTSAPSAVACSHPRAPTATKQSGRPTSWNVSRNTIHLQQQLHHPNSSNNGPGQVHRLRPFRGQPPYQVFNRLSPHLYLRHRHHHEPCQCKCSASSPQRKIAASRPKGMVVYQQVTRQAEKMSNHKNAVSVWLSMKLGNDWPGWSVGVSFMRNVLLNGLDGRGSVPCINFRRLLGAEGFVGRMGMR